MMMLPSASDTEAKSNLIIRQAVVYLGIMLSMPMASKSGRTKAPKIALIGGGTGSFAILQGLKDFTPNISALVSMSDSGGSTGVLRDELGVLPPGDIRQCLVALSDKPEWRDIFSYRFGGQGPLAGHSLGNLILSAISLQHNGDFAKAVKITSKLLNITGKVVPVTLKDHALVLHDGAKVIKGEHNIENHVISDFEAIIELEPEATINPEAAEAIQKADLVVIAPGSLYGSLLPALAVKGIREAFKSSKAKKIALANLVTKLGQTDGWHVVDHVKTLERYLGKDQFDFVLYNNRQPSPSLLKKYAADGEFPVKTDEARFAEIRAEGIGSNLVAGEVNAQDPNDRAKARTFIRHDSHQVGRLLIDIFRGMKTTTGP